jgi:hypothetical protein
VCQIGKLFCSCFLRTLSQLRRLYNVQWEDDWVCSLVYFATFLKLHRLYFVKEADDDIRFLVYLITLSQVHRLITFSGRMNGFIS